MYTQATELQKQESSLDRILNTQQRNPAVTNLYDGVKVLLFNAMFYGEPENYT